MNSFMRRFVLHTFVGFGAILPLAALAEPIDGQIPLTSCVSKKIKNLDHDGLKTSLDILRDGYILRERSEELEILAQRCRDIPSAQNIRKPEEVLETMKGWQEHQDTSTEEKLAVVSHTLATASRFIQPFNDCWVYSVGGALPHFGWIWFLSAEYSGGIGFASCHATDGSSATRAVLTLGTKGIDYLGGSLGRSGYTSGRLALPLDTSVNRIRTEDREGFGMWKGILVNVDDPASMPQTKIRKKGNLIHPAAPVESLLSDFRSPKKDSPKPYSPGIVVEAFEDLTKYRNASSFGMALTLWVPKVESYGKMRTFNFSYWSTSDTWVARQFFRPLD